MIRPHPLISMAINLRRVFPAASFVGCGDIRVTSATDNSRDCQPGTLFAAIRGCQSDGHDFVADALRCGASALLVERPQADALVPQCVVPDTRRAYALLCAALQGDPTRHLNVAGVTGTNGKTTITWLIRAILQDAAIQTGLLGTVEYNDGQATERSTLTTPGPKEIASWLGRMVRQRTTHAALEISSHALDQRRTAGIDLDVAILANITQDHFDYHQTYEAYRTSKLRIFEHLKPGGLAVLNADDPGSASCIETVRRHRVTYGIEQPADITATIQEETLAGSTFRMRIGRESVEVHTRLIGRHNVSNCLAAAAAAQHFGLTPRQIADGIESLTSVPGRMEPVECGQPFSVFVDYAHTDDALRRAIGALRRITAGRVICVFGAGGDRDRSKRPLLGQAASLADIAVLTSDNPRSEDPEQIIREVAAGFSASAARPQIRPEREDAIHWALAHAAPGDSVLVAGKGHETEQIVGTQRRHFDDREVIRRQLGMLHLIHRNTERHETFGPKHIREYPLPTGR